MGDFRTRGTTAGAVTFLSMFIIFTNFYLFIDFLATPSSPVPHFAWFYVVATVYAAFYLLFIFTLVRSEVLYGVFYVGHVIGLCDKPAVPGAYCHSPTGSGSEDSSDLTESLIPARGGGDGNENDDGDRGGGRT